MARAGVWPRGVPRVVRGACHTAIHRHASLPTATAAVSLFRMAATTGERANLRPGASLPTDRADEAGDYRKVLVGAGVIAILAGIGSILVPNIASVSTAVFVGIGLLFVSVAFALQALGTPGLSHKLMRGLAALLTLAAGLYLLISPLDGVYTLTVILVLWFLGLGIAQIASGIAEIGTPGWAYTVAAGSLSLLFGLFVANELPSSADWAIGLLVGIDFIVFGLLCLGRAFADPRDAERAPEPA